MSLLLFFCAVRMATVDARVDAEVCGRNALSVVAAYNGLQVEPDRLDRLLPDDAAPFSFTDLEGAARTLGLETYFVRWPVAKAARFDCPAILRVRSQPESTEPDHFIVCFGRSGEGILAADFPSSPRPLPLDRLSKIWDGEALYVEAQPARTIGALRSAKTRRFSAWCALAIGTVLIALGFARKLIRRRNRDMVNDLRRSLSIASCSLRTPRFARVAAIAALLALPTSLLFFGTGTAEPNSTLRADPDLMMVDPNDDAGKNRRVAFRLTNPTKLPITIKRVESGCACMAVRPLQHETVPPGGSVLQEVDVAIPEMGRAVRSIQVYHDAAREPLVLRARVSGKNRLPFVARKVNVMPVFSNLSDSHDAQNVVIETRERLASKPWVMGLVCDHDAVKIEPLGVDERPVAELDVVERTYSWSVSWIKIPEARELSAALRLTTADADDEPKIIGQIFARQVKAAPFSPSVVHLSRADRDREVVFTTSRGHQDPWQVADGFALPAWLSVEPVGVHGRRGLRFELLGGSAAGTETDCQSVAVPLSNPEGNTWSIPVVAEFASSSAPKNNALHH